MLIAIDPGHGGRDRYNRGPTGYIEADGALAVALAARDALQAAGVRVEMTREQDVDLLALSGAYDKAADLNTRAAIANRANADYFISIHTNAAPDPTAKGTETFCLSFGGQGERLAGAIQRSVVAALGTYDRGVKAANFAVLRETRMPAALVEVMFHSNPDEEPRLKDADTLKKAGEAIALGILGFIGVQPGQQQPQPPVKAHLVVDGQEVLGAAELRAGQLWVWSRGLAEAMGARVDWDAATQTAYVVTSGRKTPAKLPDYEKRSNCDIITARHHQLEVALIRGPLNRNGINGGYLDDKLNPLGIVVINHEHIADRVPWRPPRPVFVIDQEGADILPAVDRVDRLNAGVIFALGAGPQLLPELTNEGEFQDDVMTGARPRSAIGITADGLVKLVATEPMTLQQLVALMRQQGCSQAVNLDGGGSVGMRYGGKLIRGGGRAISTAIVLREV